MYIVWPSNISIYIQSFISSWGKYRNSMLKGDDWRDWLIFGDLLWDAPGIVCRTWYRSLSSHSCCLIEDQSILRSTDKCDWKQNDCQIHFVRGSRKDQSTEDIICAADLLYLLVFHLQIISCETRDLSTLINQFSQIIQQKLLGYLCGGKHRASWMRSNVSSRLFVTVCKSILSFLITYCLSAWYISTLSIRPVMSRRHPAHRKCSPLPSIDALSKWCNAILLWRCIIVKSLLDTSLRGFA